MEQSRRYCDDCRRYVLASRERFNHVLHSLNTAFSFGLWSPVWITLAIAHNPPWLCQRCGYQTDATAPSRHAREEEDGDEEEESDDRRWRIKG